MKVIALEGDENCGKSHTINIVYSYLFNKTPSTGIENHRIVNAIDADSMISKI